MSFGNDFVLTRLHARYGKDLKDDLVFRAAPPIVGGREFVQSGGKLEEGAQASSVNNFQGRYAIRHPWTGKLEEGSQPSSVNNFQGRYAIRHRWTGPIACAKPRRGIWGGPPNGGGNAPQPALNLAFAPRGAVHLASSINGDVPEIGLRKGVLDPAPAPAQKPK